MRPCRSGSGMAGRVGVESWLEAGAIRSPLAQPPDSFHPTTPGAQLRGVGDLGLELGAATRTSSHPALPASHPSLSFPAPQLCRGADAAPTLSLAPPPPWSQLRGGADPEAGRRHLRMHTTLLLPPPLLRPSSLVGSCVEELTLRLGAAIAYWSGEPKGMPADIRACQVRRCRRCRCADATAAAAAAASPPRPRPTPAWRLAAHRVLRGAPRVRALRVDHRGQGRPAEGLCAHMC